jgi:hypothetical protein
MSKKYIGIDLGAWQSSKTKIAVCEICKIGDNNRLNLFLIIIPKIIRYKLSKFIHELH